MGAMSTAIRARPQCDPSTSHGAWRLRCCELSLEDWLERRRQRPCAARVERSRAEGYRYRPQRGRARRRASRSGAAERGGGADALPVRDLRCLHRAALRRQPAGGAARRARGSTAAQMQAIAAEFNYSETTFVLPPADPAHLARVRIFTPRFEMPFAGHPTVGTALVLAWLDRVPAGGEFVLEEQAGPVPVRVRTERMAPLASPSSAAPAAPHARRAACRRAARGGARARCRRSGDGGGLPCVASCGAPFLLVELASLDALARAAALDARPSCRARPGRVSVHPCDTATPAVDLRARMFAPAHGVAEDPATGSAAAALGRLSGRPAGPGRRLARLAHRAGRRDGPAEPDRRRGRIASAVAVAEVRIGGTAVPVAEGTIEVDA